MDWCTQCGDGYDEVEYAPAPLDPDEPRFCSDSCDHKYWESVEFSDVYWEAGQASPVW